jgi:hypothetical protein
MRGGGLGFGARTAAALALVIAGCACAPAFAQEDPGPFGPFAGYSFDPAAFSQTEQVPAVEQPDWSKLPVFNTYFGSGGMLNTVPGHYESVTTGQNANGDARVYVASSKTDRVYVFDGKMPINPPAPPAPLFTFGAQPGAGTLQDPAGIAYYRGEIYVVDRYLPNPGQDRVVVYDATDGSYKRSFPLINPRGLFNMSGVDAIAGEVWVTGELCGGFAGVVEIYDAQTGAVKGVIPHVGHAPTGDPNAPCNESSDPSAWWDIATVPEINAAIAQYRLISRGLIAQLSTPDLELTCETCFRRLWQDGIDAVWGMHWMEAVFGTSGARGTSVADYSIDSLPGGSPFLTERRTWTTKQAASGGVRDVAYQNRDTRIDWDGNLTQPDWQHNDANGHQCLNYVVSDADIFAVGDQGEHWWELAKGFVKIEFYVDGNLVATQTTNPGTYCLDESTAPSGVHDVLAKAYVNDGAKVVTAENKDLHVDHDAPAGAVDAPGQFARGTVTITGSMSDSHSGPRDWQLQANGPGTGGAWQSVCSPVAPDPIGRASCQWDTTSYADGAYQLRAQLRDKVENPFGGPNVSYTATLTTTVDNTPPSLANFMPDLGQLGEDVATDEVIPVGLTQTDATSGMQQTQFQVNDATDGSANGAWHDVGSSTASGDVQLDWSTANLPAGLHRIRFQSRDRAGNQITKERQFVVADDRTPADRQPMDAGDSQVQAAKTCPGKRCYANVYAPGKYALSFGIQGTLRVPNATIAQSSGQFSVDWLGVGALPESASLQGGYDSSGCDRNYREGWYIYFELVRKSGKGILDCPSKTTPRQPGETNSFSVRVYRDPRLYEGRIYRGGAIEYIDKAPISGQVGQYWLGKRGRRSTQGSAETTRRGRRNIGFFSSVQISPSGPDSFVNLIGGETYINYPYQIDFANSHQWCASGPKPGSAYTPIQDCSP